MRHRRGARQRQASDHRQNSGEGDRGDKAEEQVAAHRIRQMHRRHIIAADKLPGRVFEHWVRADQHDGAEADDKGQNIEVAHKTGGVEHAFTRFFGVAHGKETHQDMRQAGGTKHQTEAKGERGYRIFHQPAWAHNRRAFRVDGHRFGKQIIEAEADVLHHHKGHKAGAEQQQNRFDNLHPGGRQHAAEQDIEHHQDAHQHHRNVIVKAEQQLDQLAGANHLGDQIEGHHHQRAAGGEGADRSLFETIGRHVGKGVAAKVAQTFGNQKQDNRPADKEAQRVDQTVVTGGIHQRGDTKERRCRHKVAGNRQPVLETGDIAAGGVVIAARTHPF